MFTEKSEFQKKLQKIFSDRLLVNESMKNHTTFHIGGQADFIVNPASIEEIRQAFFLANEFYVPVTVLGNGSNILVSDKGISGLVICFDASFSRILQKENTLLVQSGAILGAVSAFAAQHSLSGLEFAVGIPGSIGGAVFMNAGAYDGEMKNVIKGVTALTKNGEIKHYNAEELDLGYRHSIFQENEEIICETELELNYGEQVLIKEKMAGFTERRIQKQPLEFPSAGSTFKRPQGFFAGTLIEQAGLKGFSVGGAQVSEKHAGFIVNRGSASANDVLNLISNVQKVVFDKFSVKLEPEIKIIGIK